jgi:V/A-type H+-transporting ATPase subunit K
MVDVGSLTTGAGVGLGAGLAMGLSALAAAWSQGTLGSAALGVVAERPEFESKVIIYLVLPELLALFGLIIAFLLQGHVGNALA